MSEWNLGEWKLSEWKTATIFLFLFPKIVTTSLFDDGEFDKKEIDDMLFSLETEF